MTKLKKLLKAFLCLFFEDPKNRPITMEEFWEMEGKKINQKPTNERMYPYDF